MKVSICVSLSMRPWNFLADPSSQVPLPTFSLGVGYHDACESGLACISNVLQSPEASWQVPLASTRCLHRPPHVGAGLTHVASLPKAERVHMA